VRRILAIVTPLAGLFVFSWAQTFFSAAAAVAVPACSNTDAGGIVPITGIEVLSDTLTAGFGCGTGPSQVFKYVTIVTVAPQPGLSISGSYVAGGVADCFTNATFQNLCTYGLVDGGTESTYDVTVYAFNQAQWNLTLLPDGGPTFANVDTRGLNGLDPPPTPANACQSVSSGALPSQLAAAAGWIAHCTATQQSNIPVVAECGPLVPVNP